MVLATVVIPISQEHRLMGVFEEAIQSVRQQTIATDYITIFDDDQRGAAWARNSGTSQVETPFVIWLDADDLLHPEFVERCVSVYERGAYVYTNWKLHGHTYVTPDHLEILEQGMQHVITTLMPTVAWRDSGGFDEEMPVLEDEDFYMKLAAYGWCGVHYDQALITYRREKGFSLVNRDVRDQDIIQAHRDAAYRKFKTRYERYKMLNNCTKRDRKIQANNQRKNNSVLCEALYTPCKQVGPASGRVYPSAGLRQPLWVDYEDAKARPDLWRMIASNPEKISPNVERVMELYERAKAKKEPIPAPFIESSVGTIRGSVGEVETVTSLVEAKVLGNPKISNEVWVVNYEGMPMRELWRIVKEHDLQPSPTGKNNRYRKVDLLAVLS